MFLKLLILSVFFMGLAFAFLGIRMLLRRGGSFPDTHISSNPEMQKRGITCAQKTDVGCNPAADGPGCCSCSLR
ncbi:MAG: hypothetical protein U0X39_12520 [Bacteroidales bacterium]